MIFIVDPETKLFQMMFKPSYVIRSSQRDNVLFSQDFQGTNYMLEFESVEDLSKCMYSLRDKGRSVARCYYHIMEINIDDIDLDEDHDRELEFDDFERGF